MKHSMIIAVIASFAFSAYAESVSKSCYRKAEKAVESATAEESNYDEDGFNAFACEVATNGKVVICDVAASKGGGDASDTYRVVMSLSCAKTFRVELTGEE